MNIDEMESQFLKSKSKFIFVTGGVCSSIGKGILISSLGTLLKNTKSSVSVVKCDPYLNVDPGTISPLVHGEVFVTDDGAETDLDLGHYERILDVRLTQQSSVSSGQIFKEVLDGERKGVYLGGDIQLIPHVVDVIKKRLLNFALTTKVEFVLVEIGGTVGDMEGDIFLEAVRQMHHQFGTERIMHCHLSYVPYLKWADELKTKPTQHSVMSLKKVGIKPDALFLRADSKVEMKAIKKLSLLCGIPQDLIFQVPTTKPVYRLFSELHAQGAHDKIRSRFKLRKKLSDLGAWKSLIRLIERKKPQIKIGVVAKYVGSNEPYISVIEAIKSAGWACNRDVEIVMIDSEKLEKNIKNISQHFKGLKGIIIPGGFDKRGAEGKIAAVTWARKKKMPCLGLCLGLQIMLIEFARNLVGLKGASSMEFDKMTPYPVITLLGDQAKVTERGGTMRLGAYPCSLVAGTKARQIYGTSRVLERHRHRYEFNNYYRDDFIDKGIVFSGLYKEKDLIEIAELHNHPFMIGVQFHPEFLSRPLRPHPLFKAFIEAIVKKG